MWATIATFALSIIKWIFGGKQQAEGEAQGKAEQAFTDENQEMQNEADAQAARNSVVDSPSVVRDDPDNAGPADRG